MLIDLWIFFFGGGGGWLLLYCQGWKPKPKPENPVLMEILETQTETETYLAKFLKT